MPKRCLGTHIWKLCFFFRRGKRSFENMRPQAELGTEGRNGIVQAGTKE